MEILATKELNKIYGAGDTAVNAVRDVTFSVSKGEFATIIGPSGSGKSTLLNLLGALDTPTSGKVILDGNDIFKMKEKELSVFRRRNIGFIFQAYNLIPELNVEENIIFPILLDYQKPDKAYIEDLLNVLGLKDRRHHLPSQLSGGQQQRVAIGRALAAKPAIILADEPTGNLDTQNTRDVIQLLKLSVERYSQTLIMITHNQNLTSYSDRVFQVEDGILTELGRGELR
jgi:putative ABC transport system ATP-binding protein